VGGSLPKFKNDEGSKLIFKLDVLEIDTLFITRNHIYFHAKLSDYSFNNRSPYPTRRCNVRHCHPTK